LTLKVRLVLALCLATIVMVGFGATYLNKISQAAAGQPVGNSETIGGAQMYDIVANKGSRRTESRVA